MKQEIDILKSLLSWSYFYDVYDILAQIPIILIEINLSLSFLNFLEIP